MLFMTDSKWDSYARVNAGQRYRAQSAAIGSQVTQAIVDEARIVPGLHVLDVACGSGEPSISIAALMRGSGHVVGIDLAAASLQVARERAGARQAYQYGISSGRRAAASVCGLHLRSRGEPPGSDVLFRSRDRSARDAPCAEAGRPHQPSGLGLDRAALFSIDHRDRAQAVAGAQRARIGQGDVSVRRARRARSSSRASRIYGGRGEECRKSRGTGRERPKNCGHTFRM